MKKTPLVRRTPLKRAPFRPKPKAGAKLKRTPLRQVSEKQAKLNSRWAAVKKKKLAANPVCQFVDTDGTCCTKRADDVHHVAGRGRHLLTWKYLMSVCRFPHHDWIDTHRRQAEALGYIVRDNTPYDPRQETD